MQTYRVTSPDSWIAEIFSAKAAQTGGVIRRNVDWVTREVGEDLFMQEVRRRGFRLLRAGNQFIVVCSPSPVYILF